MCVTRLHGDGADVERHERVAGHEQVEQARDLRQPLHIVREPGDVPAERKVGQHAALADALRQLRVRLHRQ